MDENKLGFLTVEDIYNFYGLTMVEKDSLTDDDKKLYKYYLTDIKQKYIESLAHRIRLEAKWMGLDLQGNSIASLVTKLSAKIDEEIQKQAQTMRMTGAGFNVLDFVKSQMPQKPSRDLDNAADSFRSKEGKSRAAFGGEPWAKISDAFLKVETAQTEKDIIQAIDLLNSLQHNCCHVLFDLTNTRGASGDDASAVKAVLEEKFKAKTPKEFEKKMGSDVRKFLKSVGAL